MIGKSRGANFNEAVGEVKSKIKINDNFLKNDNVNGCFEFIYVFKKVGDQLPNFFGYDIETHNDKNDASPYCNCVYRLNNIAARYNHDLTHEEMSKCNKDAFVFDNDD